MKNDPRNWPKLSETLQHERHPGICQACGIMPLLVDGRPLQFWRECDEHDHHTDVVVALCPECAKRLIEPHPRLYHEEPENKPIPGAMPHLCVACRWREGLSCTHPKRKANGGPGLEIATKAPLRGFADGTRGGRRTGWAFEIWEKPAIGCEGQEPMPTPEE